MEKSIGGKALQVLEILDKAEGPLGAWVVTSMLNKGGVEISYATVGRLLNELEQNGYLLKCEANQGREITSKGREFLSGKMLEERLSPNYQELREIINSNTLHKYLMVLEARKAIESATARLAAKHASDDQIVELEKIVNKREEAISQKKTVHEYDVEFHSLIAEASGNKILSLLYQTIAIQGQQSELFEMIRKRVAGKYESSHKAICEAIKNRDEGLAERQMINHLESLINDVTEYGHKYLELN